MASTSPSTRRPTPLEPLTAAVESASTLDRPAAAAGRAIRAAIGPGRLKDVLSGTWLGHALHPLLTDVVIGSFTSASLLDLLGPRDDGRSSERLIGVGIAAALPTALTGATDWADAEPADGGVRRTGAVHALSNTLALGLYSASLAARRRGRGGAGVALGAAGAAALAASGYLGAHLTYAKGVGADQTVYDSGPRDWTPALGAGSPSEGRAVRGVAADTPVLVVRRGERLLAIHDRCSHRGCALSDGEVDGDAVVCGCHGSRFALADGAVLRGPATAPQPAFEAREREGQIEVRRR